MTFWNITQIYLENVYSFDKPGLSNWEACYVYSDWEHSWTEWGMYLHKISANVDYVLPAFECDTSKNTRNHLDDETEIKGAFECMNELYPVTNGPLKMLFQKLLKELRGDAV